MQFWGQFLWWSAIYFAVVVVVIVLLCLRHFYRLMRLRSLLLKGNSDEALRYLDATIKSIKKNDQIKAGFLLAKVEILKQSARWQEALDAANEAVEMAPRWGQGYASRGLIHLSQSRLNKGREDLEKAYSLSPRDPLVRHGMSLCKSTFGYYSEGLAIADKLVRDRPRLYFGHLSRALALIGKLEFEQAMESLGKAIELDPLSQDYKALKSIGLCELARLEEASALVESVLAVDPDSATAITAQIKLCLYQKEYAQGIALLRQQMERVPHQSGAYIELAGLLVSCPDAEFRNADEAFAIADQLQSFELPIEPSRLSILAAAHAEKGDFDQAIATQQLAIDSLQAKPEPHPFDVEMFALYMESYRAGKPVREEPKPYVQRVAELRQRKAQVADGVA